ncbi:MAG: hypothetical protein LBM73_03535 [Candidatus Nomurabacteria bacterium]|jgi:hypothetical protein|nr:hypothetical protein [Candidatus Nomurabacteria bacterium]
MSIIKNTQILYLFEHDIKDVCKIGIGTIQRAKSAYKYLNGGNQNAKHNKLAIYEFENVTALEVEKICKQVLRRIGSTEFYQIGFYKACILFKLLGGRLDEENSRNIDRSKISIKIASPTIKSEIPLSERFAEQIMKLIDTENSAIIERVKNLLNNNGRRNVLLTETEFSKFNQDGSRTGWKKYKNWHYRTGMDATALSGYIRIVENHVNV